MPAKSASHAHRHYKTLVALVLSMTGGTIFLFWLGNITPVTPLRGKAQSNTVWNRITVRTDTTASGFFHFRIDENGSLFQTQAWKIGQHSPRNPGSIEILLTSQDLARPIAAAQREALSRTLSDLRRQYQIAADRVTAEQPTILARSGR